MQGMQKKAKNGNWQPYLFSTSCVGEFKNLIFNFQIHWVL